MKYTEFHRMVIQQGWVKIRQSGSHVIYEKNGVKSVVPNHGSKEIPEGLRKTLVKRMGLK